MIRVDNWTRRMLQRLQGDGQFSAKYQAAFSKGYQAYRENIGRPLAPGVWVQIRTGLPDGFNVGEDSCDTAYGDTFSHFWYFEVYGFEIDPDESTFSTRDEAIGGAWAYRDTWMADNGRDGQ